MKSILALLTLAFGVALAWDTSRYTRKEHYDGQKLLSCPAHSRGRSLESLARRYDLNIWEMKGDRIEIRLYPTQEENKELMSHLQNCVVIVEDLEEMVLTWEKDFYTQQEAADEWFEAYHDYDEIKQWYADAANQYPSLATYTSSIGKTVNNRDMFRLVFTGTGGGSNKPRIYFQCQIHAREWISGAVCNFVTNHLLSGYGVDQNVTALMDSVEFHLVPIVNPDGYDYTWTNDRLWRKNRVTNAGSTCLGVDLNRNYNSHWSEGGSSDLPCSDTYHGSAANSENETKNTIGAFQNAAPVIGAIDWHSYSQLILRPYGWTRDDSPDEPQLQAIGDAIRDAVYDVHGVRYTSQKSIDLYITTGTASDWFYDEEATDGNNGYRAAGYTIELRDTGRYGFELPPDQIIPCGEEMVAGVFSFVNDISADPIEA